jgi:SAM-dependent methyltransferase
MIFRNSAKEIATMSDTPGYKDDTGGGNGAVKYYKRDFWSEENLKFTRPHFRLQKSARIINKMARGEKRDLLDVGCGPGTLGRLLDGNIRYHGIDIAIHEPAPNFIEADLLKGPIRFGDKQFDIVVAQGLFEYLGEHQSAKFAEIRQLLRPDGTFIVTYVNFGHHKKQIYWPYSNIQSRAEFRESLARYFRIERSFPVAHNWQHGSPRRRWLQAIQMPVNLNIPAVSPVLAPEYFFICCPLAPQQVPA